MMAEPIQGGLFRADSDSINGWCWCPSRPQLQCTVEVLIDGVVWRELKANRRAEGVRLNGPPHDHFGFLAALPAREGAVWHRIEVREQRTGLVFGRLMEGGPDPERQGVELRIDAVREQAEAVRVELAELPRPVGLAAILGAVGTGLLGLRLPAVQLAVPAIPRVTLVICSCEEAEVAYRAITALVGPASDLAAEVLLLGDLRRGRLAELASVVRGLQLIDGSLGDALLAARGEFVLVVDGTRLDLAPDLGRWLLEGVTVGALGAALAAWRGVVLPAPERDESGLILGIRRDDWRAMAGIEAEGMAAAVVDVAMQARVLGLTLRTAGPVDGA